MNCQPCPTQEIRDAADGHSVGPTMLSHWAAYHGLSDADALILISAVLGGLGNGMPSLSHGAIAQPVEPFSLVVPIGSPALQALDALTGQALGLQRMLVQRARSIPLAAVEQAYLAGIDRSPNSELFNSLEHEPTYGPDLTTADSALAKDIMAGERDRIFEKTLRPAMLLSGSLPEALAGHLPNFHGGSMLAAPGLVRLPSDKRQRMARIDELMTFGEGAEVPSIKLHRNTPGAIERVRLCGLIAMPPADMRWMLEHRRDFFQVFIPWVPPLRRANLQEIDLNKVFGLNRILVGAAPLVIANRRASHSLRRGFSDMAAASQFLFDLQRFSIDCAALGEERPVASAGRIMPALAWALFMAGASNELQVADLAREAARHLAGGVIRFFDQADFEALAADRQRLANKIVARITKTGPVKRRELVRGFANQSLDLFNPVIAILSGLGVIQEDRGLLELGSEPVSRVAREQFLPPPTRCYEP